MDHKIFGVDFTSVPSARKPITCARATLAGDLLTVTSVDLITNWESFESFLSEPGPWRAGFDFPFGQANELYENLEISGNWATSVENLTNGFNLTLSSRKAFEERIRHYCSKRQPRSKHHSRVTDHRASSCSPMTFYGTPVAKMFFEGAPRLIRAGLSVLPSMPTSDLREAVEAYPKLIAARYLERGAKYKIDSRKKASTQQKSARETILSRLELNSAAHFDGFRVVVASSVRERAVDDHSGDVLDAILCAVQAAWSKRSTAPLNGIPENTDLREGWIVDPALLQQATEL